MVSLLNTSGSFTSIRTLIKATACQVFANDQRCLLFDIYNADIYPSYELESRRRLDCNLPLHSDCADDDYLQTLKSRLREFLDTACDSPVALAIYNAGTDVFQGDPLGGLAVSADAILERDLFVVGQLRGRGIPTVMLPSGGYTSVSYRLLADSVARLVFDE
jgi:histone deacetylase 11